MVPLRDGLADEHISPVVGANIKLLPWDLDSVWYYGATEREST